MSRAPRADIGAARLIHCFGGNGFQYGANRFIGVPAAPRHDGRAETGPFLPAGNAYAQVVDALCFQHFCAPSCVLKKGIAAVQDDVPLF